MRQITWTVIQAGKKGSGQVTKLKIVTNWGIWGNSKACVVLKGIRWRRTGSGMVRCGVCPVFFYFYFYFFLDVHNSQTNLLYYLLMNKMSLHYTLECVKMLLAGRLAKFPKEVETRLRGCFASQLRTPPKEWKCFQTKLCF